MMNDMTLSQDESVERFYATAWSDLDRAEAMFFELLEQGEDPKMALRRVQCEVTQFIKMDPAEG